MFTSIIIDDESKARTNLRNLLNSYFEEVEILHDYASPKQAIEDLQGNLKVDCIFLDIEMPEMSGIKISRKMQST